jgi:hypothetical protein
MHRRFGSGTALAFALRHKAGPGHMQQIAMRGGVSVREELPRG